MPCFSLFLPTALLLAEPPHKRGADGGEGAALGGDEPADEQLEHVPQHERVVARAEGRDEGARVGHGEPRLAQHVEQPQHEAAELVQEFAALDAGEDAENEPEQQPAVECDVSQNALAGVEQFQHDGYPYAPNGIT